MLSASAQGEQPRPGWSERYGWSNREAAEPYRPESRDAAGNRILYNGRPGQIEGRGLYYRLIAGPIPSPEDARRRCEALEASEQCFRPMHVAP
eukprot:Skav229927  [mRNA]  locus=scaffold7556:13700:14827:+ [translate_table: standard]